MRILHLAASTVQARVEEVLEQLLGRGERPDLNTLANAAEQLFAGDD